MSKFCTEVLFAFVWANFEALSNIQYILYPQYWLHSLSLNQVCEQYHKLQIILVANIISERFYSLTNFELNQNYTNTAMNSNVCDNLFKLASDNLRFYVLNFTFIKIIIFKTFFMPFALYCMYS